MLGKQREFTQDKTGHILDLTWRIRYSTSSFFKNLSINWEKYVFHLDKWNFELIGYTAHITDFLGLGKVLLTYIWRWLAKCSSCSFYSACGDGGQISAHVYSLLGQIEGKRKVLFFMKLKKFLFLWNLNKPTPSFVVFRTPYN